MVFVNDEALVASLVGVRWRVGVRPGTGGRA
jgi:hypothetical protein